jgi:acyl carrier protein
VSDTVLQLVKEVIAEHSAMTAQSIDPQLTLAAIPGIESVKALRAISEIEDRLGVVIPDDFLFETATVQEMAAYVADLAEAR